MAKRESQPRGSDGSPHDGAVSEAAAGASTSPPRAVRTRRPASTGGAARTSRRRSPPPAHSQAEHSRGHGIWEWIEASGLELVGVSRLRFLLRRFGLKGVLILVLVAGYPVGQYSLISYAVNSTLPALAGDFGATFEAEEWSYHPLALKAIARNVKIRSEHDTGGEPLFTAAEVEFKGSILSSLRGLKELLTLQAFHTFNEITIRHGRLHLERSRTGTLNWSDYAEAVPEERQRELASGLYQIKAIKLEDVSVAYVEHIAGDSGGGVIQTAQATVFVDAINGAITAIGPAAPGDHLPTRVKLAARSSDGTIDLDGRVGLRPGAGGGASDAVGVRDAALRTSAGDGMGYEIVVELNNIGAAAFTRSLPSTRVMATAGSVRGRIKLRDSAPACESELAMENVKFAPNSLMVPSRAEYEVLQVKLRDRVVSKPFKGCEPLAPDAAPAGGTVPRRSPQASTVVHLAASFNEQANSDAPPEVRAAVARDSQTLTGRTVSAVLDDMTKRFSQDLAQRVGGETGALIQQAATATPPATSGAQPAGNTVTRGAKSFGGGIKRLFGGGKKSSTSKPK